ncbi:MAG: RDD family protein [Promethearchaeota archaeon]|jgi:uncharacterized RDD family membrane protein YckC
MIEEKKSIFWLRIFAFIIDIVIFSSLGILIAFFIDFISGGEPVSPFDVYIYLIISFSIPFWVYSILTDISKTGSTIGKKITRIQVIALEKEKLKLSQAIFRTIIKLLPWELTIISFFALSENWANFDNFSITQIVLFVISSVLILIYLIFLIKRKGFKAFHDLLSKTQVKSVK